MGEDNKSCLLLYAIAEAMIKSDNVEKQVEIVMQIYEENKN